MEEARQIEDAWKENGGRRGNGMMSGREEERRHEKGRKQGQRRDGEEP